MKKPAANEVHASHSTDGGMLLAEATIDDLDTLVVFNRTMARETEGLELDEATVRAGLKAMLLDQTRGRYMVARDSQGRLVGQVAVTTEWSDWRNAWFWWIQSVYVVPEARGRGIYGALHREVERQARFRGDVCGLRLYVAHQNRTAQSVYAVLGMKPSEYMMYEATWPMPPQSRDRS